MEDSSNKDLIYIAILVLTVLFLVMLFSSWQEEDGVEEGVVKHKKYLRGKVTIQYFCDVELASSGEMVTAICNASCFNGQSVKVRKLESVVGDSNYVMDCR